MKRRPAFLAAVIGIVVLPARVALSAAVDFGVMRDGLIFCNEGEEGPGVQRLDLATGEVATIVTGTAACDPAQVTPWGTVVFGEENGGGAEGGRLYELIDPLHTTNVLLDRTTGVFTDGPGGEGASNIVVRTALGILSYEVVGVLPNGVVYYGDENRPLTGTAGDAYFKFVPSTLRDPDTGPISSLSESPLASGSIYGPAPRQAERQHRLRSGNGVRSRHVDRRHGVSPVDLRAATATLKLTGYYRPEDLAFDHAALEAGDVVFCGNNTGNEATDHLWGNTICVTDGTIVEAGANMATPELLVAGNPEFAMMDNISYQPGRGNWIIHEDGDNVTTGRNNDLSVLRHTDPPASRRRASGEPSAGDDDHRVVGIRGAARRRAADVHGVRGTVGDLRLVHQGARDGRIPRGCNIHHVHVLLRLGHLALDVPNEAQVVEGHRSVAVVVVTRFVDGAPDPGSESRPRRGAPPIPR